MVPDTTTLLLEIAADVRDLRKQVATLNAEIEALRNGASGEVWLRTTPAAIALKSQGVRSASTLRGYVRNGILNVAQGQIRNASSGDGRPEWEFNIAACATRIAWFKALDASQKRAIAS